MDDLLPATTTHDIKSVNPTVAVLPVGSLEQHGPFLPLTTDTRIACIIGQALASSYPVQLLSPVTISCSHEHAAWPGTVSISATTLYALIADIHDSLVQSGVRALVLINAHGGNYVLRNIVQERTVGGPSMALFPGSSDWAAARSAAAMTTSDHEDMHAGELETSILLHACPSVVRDGYQIGDHIADERPALLTRGMSLYTESGVIGRPSQATADKGKAALASLTDSFARCMTSLGMNQS